MADWQLSVSSTEYIPVVVTATVAGVAFNPTADSVSFDFQISPTPANPTRNWITGLWESTTTQPYRALGLVGGSGFIPTVPTGASSQTYDVWLRVTDSPEVPIRKVGTLLITNP